MTKVYYSLPAAGLANFKCTVHPDWHSYMVSALNGKEIANDDSHLVLLNQVKITLHAHMKGGSSLEFNDPPDNRARPLDAASERLIGDLHQTVEQTLQGFMQFWKPFVDGTIIPKSTEVDLDQIDNGYRLRGKSAKIPLTEDFDRGLIMQHLGVTVNGTTISLTPGFQNTDHGLLVNSYHAHIQFLGTAQQETAESKVFVEYQTIDSLPLPSKINMTVTRNAQTLTLNFTLDECIVDHL